MAQLTVSAKQSKGTIRRHLFGHFSEHLGRCIYNGLYVGEGSPIPNVNGMRTDLVEALKNIRVPVLRWPGGGGPNMILDDGGDATLLVTLGSKAESDPSVLADPKSEEEEELVPPVQAARPNSVVAAMARTGLVIFITISPISRMIGQQSAPFQ